MDTHPGYCNNVFTRWRLFSCSVLLATMNLKTREKRSRGIGTALVIINFVINVFWTFFSAASRCRYASRLLLILSCSWFSYSQLSPKVLMWNCENVFNVLNVSSVKSRSLHSFPRARHSHRLWLVAVVLQSKMKPKQIVPISIFLYIATFNAGQSRSTGWLEGKARLRAISCKWEMFVCILNQDFLSLWKIFIYF